MPYLQIFYRLILRPLRSEPVRTLLTVFAVGLGVSVVLAIEMAGEAAAGSFQSSLEALTGDADFEVTAAGGVPPEVLASLVTAPYVLDARPRIEDYATVVGSRRTVAVIGVDVLADSVARTAEVSPDEEDAAVRGSENAVWVAPRLDADVGSRLRLLLNDREVEFVVRGILAESEMDIVVMDLATATRVLGRDGRLDRILIRTPESERQRDWEPVLRGLLPDSVTLSSYGSRTEENRRMLAAFRWNLRVLSYIALIVGSFLIYNTISVSVVRRRPEIGILRALGATRSAVVGAFLAEAACFGLAGALLGVVFGRVLAESAVGLVAVTVRSLYVSSRPGAIALTWEMAAFAFVLAIAVAVLSALAPAVEAAQIAPVESMARGSREHAVRVHVWRNLAIATLFGVAAWITSQQPPAGGKPVFGYVSALCMIGTGAFAIPGLVSAFAKGAARPLGRLLGVEALLATRTLAGSLRRTSVLVGALATAIAMTAAVGIMVGSFRETVLLWMDDRLKADLYLRPAAPAGPDRHPTLAPDTAERLRVLPEVETVDQFRAYEITYNRRPVTLAAGESNVVGSRGRRTFLSGADPKRVFGELAASSDAAIVSEPFSNKHGVGKGDTLRLMLGGAERRFRVLDVYYDYASERGYIVLDRQTFLKYLPDPAPSNIAVYLKPGVSLDAGREAIQKALAGKRVMVFSNASLRAEAIRTFDRTFAVTYALEAVAVIVAIMGVAGALLALVIDRRREFAVLRFLGGAREQIRRLVLFEAGILGLLANFAGIVLGVVLSLLLIFVINKQSFGWTIQFHWPVAVLLGALTLVYAATVACAVFPARVAMNLQPIEAIHEE
ncbi:MAG: ABC transporter permease [Bryobacteraceae bacterium]